MTNTTINCDLNSKNFTQLDGWLFLDSESGTVEKHVIIYAGLLILSLIFYGILVKFDCLSSNFSTTELNETPSFWRLLSMQEDEWIKKNRGVAAFDYLEFQRLLFFKVGGILLIISTVSLIINVAISHTSTQFQRNISSFDSTTQNAIKDYPVPL